jgi:hypothetical protein
VRFHALLRERERGKVQCMTRCLFFDSRRFSILCGLLIFGAVPGPVMGQPAPAAVAAFNSYISTIETRLAQQHRSPDAFLAPAASIRLHRGELIVEQLTPSPDAALPGALLHHWRGSAFAAGAKAADFERLLRDFNAYPHDFSPEVLQAGVIAQDGDRLQAWMRVRQRHVITVVMDTTYDITFGQLDAQQRYSISRSIRISEMDSSGRALNPSEEHGFLWRLNTYWSYEERDGGLYIQIESVSLTRSIPVGLGWAVGPFVKSIPRESLEFTLRSACNALRRKVDGGAE